jgi:hypothetical protein
MPNMNRFLLLAAFASALTAADAPAAFSPTFESRAALVSKGRIDDLVFARWKSLGIQPANPASDGAFFRRVYLDAIGTLPTAKEATGFLADPDPNKRAALIDRLLDRDEFPEFWAMKWSDLLRVKAEFPINLWPNAAQAYYHWILDSLRANQPYDRFVREMLTSNGSNFRDPPVNFYRAMQNRTPEGMAQTVALTFMGVRAGEWPKERLAQMAAFFSQVGHKYTGEWKEEIVFFDPNPHPPKPAGDAHAPATPPAPVPALLTFPDGVQVRLAPGQDPRQAFADWLIAPKNPWFARAIVNRIWYWLNGRGIIHEPDDIRPDNPPSNPELLAWLEGELVASHYDLKHIYRLILNSSTYQLSSIPRSDKPEAAANFAAYPLRRLDAEVLIDALCQISGLGESYTSSIPEPITFMPDDQRAIGLPDGSIGSSFLELFGRPPRDTGLESERNNRLTDAQRLDLLNSTQIQRKIQQGPKLQALMREHKPGRDLADQLYLTILSRKPTDNEWKQIDGHTRSGSARGQQAYVDLAWALVNSSEFLYRH